MDNNTKQTVICRRIRARILCCCTLPWYLTMNENIFPQIHDSCQHFVPCTFIPRLEQLLCQGGGNDSRPQERIAKTSPRGSCNVVLVEPCNCVVMLQFIVPVTARTYHSGRHELCSYGIHRFIARYLFGIFAAEGFSRKQWINPSEIAPTVSINELSPLGNIELARYWAIGVTHPHASFLDSHNSQQKFVLEKMTAGYLQKRHRHVFFFFWNWDIGK